MEPHVDPVSPGASPESPVAAVCPPPLALRREILPSSRRDRRFALLWLALGLVCVDWSLFGHFRLGFSLCLSALLISVVAYLLPDRLRLTPYAVFCGAAALCCAIPFSLYTDRAVSACLLGAMLVLTLSLLSAGCGAAHYPAGSWRTVFDLWRLLSSPLRHMGGALPSLFYVQDGDRVRRRRIGGVLLGLLCALPVLLLLLTLLTRADTAFESLVHHTLLRRPGRLAAVLLLGIALFACVFTAAFALRRRLAADQPPAAGAPGTRVDPLVLNTVLAAVLLLYLLYLFSQLAYFFSAFSGLLPETFSAAGYARRGFFEMAAICAIHLGLLWLVALLSRREDGRLARSTRWLCGCLCGFSLLLIATAFSKMGLYIQSFGMTRLRVLTCVFMAALALVFVAVLIRLWRRSFPYFKMIVVTTSLLLLATATADVDAVIARHTVESCQSGRLLNADIASLSTLSDSAVPYLARLLDDPDDAVAKEAAQALSVFLNRHYAVYHDGAGHYTCVEREADDFKSWNLSVRRAKRYLLEHAAQIKQMTR